MKILFTTKMMSREDKHVCFVVAFRVQIHLVIIIYCKRKLNNNLIIDNSTDRHQPSTWCSRYQCIDIINLIISNDMYSLIDSPFLPRYFRTFVLFCAISLVMLLIAKTDLLLGEIRSNLDQFKIFYYLINNIKSKHKLLNDWVDHQLDCTAMILHRMTWTLFGR